MKFCLWKLNVHNRESFLWKEVVWGKCHEIADNEPEEVKHIPLPSPRLKHFSGYFPDLAQNVFHITSFKETKKGRTIRGRYTSMKRIPGISHRE